MSGIALRDQFAAAALTGLTRRIPEDSVYHHGIVANQAYGLADAMLRERARVSSTQPVSLRSENPDHDAAPSARAATDSVGTDKAEPLHGLGTGDTSVTDPMPVFASGRGSVTPQSYEQGDEKRGVCDTNREPVAWAVVNPSGGTRCILPNRKSAEAIASASERVVGVPLYRSPTLTDAEREAVRFFSEIDGPHYLPVTNKSAATLRGLLERLK